jgi:hypothetical protein
MRILDCGLCLILAAAAMGANDFSGVAACQGVYLFENDLTDSSPAAGGNGANDLTDVNTIAFSATTKQGSYSADFELTAPEENYAYRADADLSANFPFKGGSANVTMTFCAWVRFESLPSSGTYRYLATKYVNTGGQRSFRFGLYSDAGTYKWWFYVRTGADAANEAAMLTPTNAVAANQWYHVAVTLDSSGNYTITAYDDTNLQTDPAGAAFTAATPVSTSEFNIGGDKIIARYHDGLIDEAVVFNSELTADEISYIRMGLYPDGPAALTPQMAMMMRRGRD